MAIALPAWRMQYSISKCETVCRKPYSIYCAIRQYVIVTDLIIYTRNHACMPRDGNLYMKGWGTHHEEHQPSLSTTASNSSTGLLHEYSGGVCCYVRPSASLWQLASKCWQLQSCRWRVCSMFVSCKPHISSSSCSGSSLRRLINYQIRSRKYIGRGAGKHQFLPLCFCNRPCHH